MFIKPGTCGRSGCTETHVVTVAPEMWKGITQYQGTHHGETFVYESFMVTEVPNVPTMPLQWVTWNMSTGFLCVDNPASGDAEFTAGAVRSIGHAVEVLGDAGYIVVSAWLASGMSDVHMVCMVERVTQDA